MLLFRENLPTATASQPPSKGSPKIVRSPGFDFVRVTASLMLVTLHVSAPLFYKFGDEFLAAVSFNSLSRSCVPLFFMLSGALLIPRAWSAKEVMSKCLRLALVLFVWSYFYLWYFWYSGGKPSWAPNQILAGPVIYHFWFFYTLLPMYLFFPILQAFLRGAAPSLHYVFLFITLLFSSLLPTSRALGFDPGFGLDGNFFALYAGYAFAGAIAAQIPITATAATSLFVLFLASSAATAIATVILSLAKSEPTEVLFSYSSPLVVLAAISIFGVMKRVGDSVAGGSRILSLVASNAVGVFIFHVFFIDVATWFGVHVGMFAPWLAIPVVTTFVWLLSLLASVCVRSIPRIGRTILPS